MHPRNESLSQTITFALHNIRTEYTSSLSCLAYRIFNVGSFYINDLNFVCDLRPLKFSPKGRDINITFSKVESNLSMLRCLCYEFDYFEQQDKYLPDDVGQHSPVNFLHFGLALQLRVLLFLDTGFVDF
jgi:hypothetical protein